MLRPWTALFSALDADGVCLSALAVVLFVMFGSWVLWYLGILGYGWLMAGAIVVAVTALLLPWIAEGICRLLRIEQ